MLNFSIFPTLGKKWLPEKKKLKSSGKFNSLSTTDSQLPSTGKKQSKSLAQPYLPTGKRMQRRLRERFSSQPTPTAAPVAKAAGEREWERKVFKWFLFLQSHRG